MKWISRGAVIGLILAGRLSGPALAFEWSADDPQDVAQAVPPSADLEFPDGFKATIRFSVDLERVSRRSRFANLFCKGDDYDGGFCVMVRYDGRLLIDLKGCAPEYYLHPATVKSGREHVLELYVTKTCVRTVIDGREFGSYAFAGKPAYAGNGKPLRIGSMGGYRFFGRLPYLKLEPLAAVTVPTGGPRPYTIRPERHQARAEVKWQRIVCAEKGRYIGWPSVCRLQNGEILAVFSGDRDGHICPYGKVQMVRSADGGESWSGPETIANGPLDDRDAGIVQLPDGRIVVTYFTSLAFADKDIVRRFPDYGRHLGKLSPEVRRNGLGYWRIVSGDNGATWSKPMRMRDVAHAPHGPSPMRDGSLIQLGRSFGKAQVDTGLSADIRSRCVVSAWRSADGGATWSCLAPDIPSADGDHLRSDMYHEPHVVELADGTLVGLVRHHGEGGLATAGNGYMRSTRSSDGGKTWTPMTPTPMLGLPPHLLELPDGKLVCVYGRRLGYPGFGEFACLSDDGGRTWDASNEVTLAHSHAGDLGYPASCLLPDGWIVTVYYQQPDVGEKPCLMATKWRVTK